MVVYEPSRGWLAGEKEHSTPDYPLQSCFPTLCGWAREHKENWVMRLFSVVRIETGKMSQ